MKDFTDRLIFLRKKNHLTQEDVAKIIQRKRSTVSGYESLDKEPDLETICVLAKYFGVTTDYLLGYSDHPDPVANVFYGDNVGFKKAIEKLSPTERQVFVRCFKAFYQLLLDDAQNYQPERVSLYGDLLKILAEFRPQIVKSFEKKNPFSDPATLSDLMSMQSQLKAEVSSNLDLLMQSDLEIAFKAKKSASEGFSGKKVI